MKKVKMVLGLLVVFFIMCSSVAYGAMDINGLWLSSELGYVIKINKNQGVIVCIIAKTAWYKEKKELLNTTFLKNIHMEESGLVTSAQIQRSETVTESVKTKCKLLDGKLQLDNKYFNYPCTRISQEMLKGLWEESSFTEKYKIPYQYRPSPDELVANPFIYEGKIIGIEAEFGEMLTATKAALSMGGTNYIVVSGIPRGTFTKSDVDVLLAVKVIGKTDLRLPIFGIVSVPHLKFVGAHFK